MGDLGTGTGAVRQVAAALRTARLARGMSQEDVAHAAGIAVSTYTRLERGSGARGTNPTLSTLRSIGRALGVRIRVVVDNAGESASNQRD